MTRVNKYRFPTLYAIDSIQKNGSHMLMNSRITRLRNLRICVSFKGKIFSCRHTKYQINGTNKTNTSCTLEFKGKWLYNPLFDKNANKAIIVHRNDKKKLNTKKIIYCFFSRLFPAKWKFEAKMVETQIQFIILRRSWLLFASKLLWVLRRWWKFEPSYRRFRLTLKSSKMIIFRSLLK